MTEKSYLLLAEQITYRNNKLTAINIWEQFTAVALPSKFNFDLAFICGPGWAEGEYDLKFKIKAEKQEEFTELGSIKVNINNEKSVFNALAQNLNFVIDKNAGNLTFVIERNDEMIFEKEYQVNYLLNIQNRQAATV